MVKIIDSVGNFNNCTEYLNISLLDNMSCYPIRLSKQCNIKNIYIGNMWWIYLCSWKPLGFDRSILYD